MTDDNSANELVDIPEDLAAFKTVFLEKTEAEVPERDTEENALATDEDEDASEDNPAEDEDVVEEDSEDEASEDDSEEDAEDEESDDQSEDDEEDEPEDKNKRRKSNYQTRINELTRNYRQEQRERAQERAEFIARIEALETTTRKEGSEQEQPGIRESLPQGAPDPNALDKQGNPKYPLLEFDPQYIYDLTEFSIERKTAEMEDRKNKETEAAHVAQAQEALKTQWGNKVTQYAEEVPEIVDHIEDLVETFKGVEPSYGEYLAMTIMSCDNGPAIMEYLSQNIGEAQKIVASGPAAATLALGRLEARLTKPARAETEEKRNKKISGSAPPPPKGVRGSSKGRTAVRPDTEDLAAFKREFLK